MRSTLKCDIMSYVIWGNCFMKTKIIYISGNEVFDMADIRAAFEEVRKTLNLDKTTVMFGVPVDTDDAGLMSDERQKTVNVPETIVENIPDSEPIIETTEEIEHPEITQEIIVETVSEPVVEVAPKKRGRQRKEEIIDEPVAKENEPTDSDEKIVPILSVLSTKSEPEQIEEDVLPEPAEIEDVEEVEIISEISEEKTEDDVDEETINDTNVSQESEDDDEADLEKLLSAMTPLAEDVLSEDKKEISAEPEYNDDISVDAPLEQLATEFAETQDKISSGNKSSSRSKIGKLRNILPFKQSKHKDQGLGDLFGWAGVAANDEDFSVPGFFTNAASKK